MVAAGEPKVVIGVIRLVDVVIGNRGPDGENAGGASRPLALPHFLDGYARYRFSFLSGS